MTTLTSHPTLATPAASPSTASSSAPPSTAGSPPPGGPAAPRRSRAQQRNPLGRLGPVVEVLRLRYPEIPLCVIREQVVDVLAAAEPGRAVPALVMRLVEARLWAMS